MTSATDTDIQGWYEERVRQALPIILYRELGFRVIEPTQGFSQNLTKKTFTSTWPLAHPTEDAQIDFVAHIPDVDVNQFAGREIVVSQQVSMHFSASTKGMVPPATRNYTSPDKRSTSPNEPTRYLFAEITYGGKESAKKKVEQLERACQLAIAKAEAVTGEKEKVLDVVLLVMVVSPKPISNDIFNFVRGSSAYPNVTALFQVGRFCFLRDAYTLAESFRITTEQIGVLGSDVGAMGVDLESVKADVEVIKVDISKIAKSSEASNLMNYIQNAAVYGATEKQLELARAKLALALGLDS